MNEIFNFKNKEVRIKNINNEPYFNLKDVCEILEISNASQVITRLSEKGLITTDTLTKGGIQKLNFINESNLYKLIFKSRKPQAEEFTEWVTSEVLPTIRKYGAYMTDKTIEQALTNPDFLIQLATNLKEEKEKNKKLEEKIETDKPKVIFAEALEVSDKAILIGELAKILKQNGIDIGQNRLFEYLRKNGYLCSRGEQYNSPTQRALELKLFEIKTTTINNPDGSVRVTRTTKVTPKGQSYFINQFKKA